MKMVKKRYDTDLERQVYIALTTNRKRINYEIWICIGSNEDELGDMLSIAYIEIAFMIMKPPIPICRKCRACVILLPSFACYNDQCWCGSRKWVCITVCFKRLFSNHCVEMKYFGFPGRALGFHYSVALLRLHYF